MENSVALTVNPVGHALAHHTGAAARYVEAGLTGAPNTARAYAAHLKRFSAWCTEHGFSALPAPVDALVGFCTHLAEAGKKVGTLEQHCAAISKAHAVRGVDSPTDDKQFKIFMDGVRRVHGVRQKQAPAFTLAQLKQLVRSLDVQTVTGLRDRAILLLGFTGAFRRSELTALNVQDLRFTEECLVVSLGKSKTNQLGDYEEKAIFYSPEPAVCPIRSLKAWLEQLERSEGPVFVMLRKGNRLTTNRLSDQTINTLVQRYLGLGYTAHSLRASFVTVAKLNGADDSKIMNQTKHKTSAMIRRYTRLDNVQQHNAAKELGL
ncbi:site-specific integrase [Hymenobacter sublimis]|uniref:Site-specific integrase n=1 Tax=Hymenobacter sublimis TaxID=2933777 RepID=A0ABY4JEK1_9BACT|nr:site-specific integrase [Hymenobacter sublimis]UPL51265.1 site-specific integrase [Hymenobacter sublimis]